jgi:hypothetical protein
MTLKSHFEVVVVRWRIVQCYATSIRKEGEHVRLHIHETSANQESRKFCFYIPCLLFS